MKIMCLLNGPKGWQTGIEEGLTNSKDISSTEFIYYQYMIDTEGRSTTEDWIRSKFNLFQPDIFALFHLGKYNFSSDFWTFLEEISSKVLLVYDEGDMYGGLAKPITNQMKKIARISTVVSLRGYGKFKFQMARHAKSIIYTPHSNDIASLMKVKVDLTLKKKKIVKTGNLIKKNWRKLNIRLEGAAEREYYLTKLCELYPDKVDIYGANWQDVACNRGTIDFQKQYLPYLKAWFAFAYEHYPKEYGYFSNRLPIALSCGCIYISHYNESYLDIFPEDSFFYMYRDSDELENLLEYLFTLDEDTLVKKALSAIEYYEKHLNPVIVWGDWVKNVIENHQNRNKVLAS